MKTCPECGYTEEEEDFADFSITIRRRPDESREDYLKRVSEASEIVQKVTNHD